MFKQSPKEHDKKYIESSKENIRVDTGVKRYLNTCLTLGRNGENLALKFSRPRLKY